MANSTELSIVIRARNEAEKALSQIDSQFKAMNTSIQVVMQSANDTQGVISAIGELGETLGRVETHLKTITDRMGETEKASNDINLSLFTVSDSFKALSENTASYERTTQMANETVNESKGFFSSLTDGIWTGIKAVAGLTVGYYVMKKATADANIESFQAIEALKKQQEELEATTRSIAKLAENYQVSGHAIAESLVEISQGAVSLNEALLLVTKNMGDSIQQTVNEEAALRKFADRTRVLVEDLSEADKALAIKMAVEEKARGSLDKHGEAILTISERFKLLTQNTEEAEKATSLWEKAVKSGMASVLLLRDSFYGITHLIGSGWARIAGATETADMAMKSAESNYRKAVNVIREMLGLEIERGKVALDNLEKTSAQNKAAREAAEKLNLELERIYAKNEEIIKVEEEAGKAFEAAFSTLGIVRVEKEIEKLEGAYRTLKDSGKATAEELSQAWDNKEEKIAKLRGEVDQLAEAFKLLGIESVQTVSDKLEKLNEAYETVKASGEASAITIAQAWLKVRDEQEKVNDFTLEWEKIITSRVLPAVNAYVSAIQSTTAAQVAASRTTFDAKLKDIADSAKNAGNSIADIDAKMAGKFSEGAKKAEEQARAIGNLRQAANAHADDIDRIGNAQIDKYGRIIEALKSVGATDRQVQEYAIAAGKEHLNLLEARLSAERATLAEMIKIRDENINSYRQTQEAIKQLKDQSLDVDKKAQDLRDALADKNFTAEENAMRQTLRMRMQMYDTENMANDRKMKILGEIGQKAAQTALTMKAGSLEEASAAALAQDAYAKEKELLEKLSEEKNKEAELSLKNAKAFELSIARQRELVSALAKTVETLNETLGAAKLEAKITLLDEALAPAKELKAELQGLFDKDIIQTIKIKTNGPMNGENNSSGGNNPEGLNLNPQFGESSGGEGDGLPSYASGISYVPRDQVARIHQGEAVLTKEENALFRAGKFGNVSFGDIIINPPKGVEITSAVALEIRKKLGLLERRVR